MRSWVKTVLIFIAAIFLVWLFWTFMLFQVRVTSDDGAPQLLQGDRVLVNRWSYGFRLPLDGLFGLHRFHSSIPQKGDLLAFNDPCDNHHQISDRPICLAQCAALPGETIWLDWTPGDSNFQTKKKQKFPFVIPQENLTVDVHPWNIQLLANALHLHEGKNVCWNCDSLLVIDGIPQRKVRFSQNYVWVISSSSKPAYDSRMFGLLPQSHLIGRLVCTSYSLHPSQPLLRQFRPERFFIPLPTSSHQ